MHLKSVEMNGFKSFANKTVLTFLPDAKGHKSITAVVGPNGSGKSNVSDAIRWVMGEQRMKTLRGKKSEDVIFSGSASKGKMGMASVTITIDNKDGSLPIEYDELVVSRRYYRSGESEYLINGSPVRLLDLQLLLAKAQFGQGSYSIIGQGQIDSMLLQSPSERKIFFDEASGIKELQIKRHQASLKLTRTREHMSQAELLLNEVSPRLKTLSRQVKKLEQRQEVEHQLRETQEVYYTTLWHHHQTHIEQLKGSLAQIGQTYDASQSELTAIQEELATLAKEASRQEVFASLQQAHQTIVDEKNGYERDRAVLQGKLQTEYRQAGKHDLTWLDQKIEERNSAKAAVDQDIEMLKKELTSIEEGMAKHEGQKQEHVVDQTALRSRLQSLEHRMHEFRGEQQLFHAIGLRAVQAILEERHQFGGVHGAVAQLGDVQKEYQTALDVAAGSHLSSLVVADDSVAQSCIAYLRKQQLGIATFLPLTKMRPRVAHNVEEFLGRKGVHGLAVDLVKYDDRFAPVFEWLFGSTLIVDDIQTARAIGIGKIRMVTLDGDVLETSGSMKGGFRKRKQQGLSFSQGGALFMGSQQDHTAELEKTQDALSALEKAIRDLDASLLEQTSAREAAKTKLSVFVQQKQDGEKELAALEQEQKLYTMSPKEYSAAMKDLAKEKDAIDARLADAQKRLDEAQRKIDHFHQEEETKKQRVFALQGEMQETQATLNQLAEEKNKQQVEAAKYETKQEDLANDVYQEMHMSIESIVKRGIAPRSIDDLEELQTAVQKFKYKLSLIGGIDEQVVAEFAEVQERHQGLTTQLDDLHKAMTDLEKLIVELDGIMKKKRDKAFSQIKKEFSRYFSVLFEGGKADLVEVYGPSSAEASEGEEDLGSLEDEEDPSADTQSKPKRKKKVLVGIDITACPPGKKIRHLQALSGGERTLTSIALICAILRTNPSPFVLLDEVEAALDEANTMRLNNILRELSKQSQFILITHNRATMHAADALYGVTMGNDGISHVLSVKLESAAADLPAGKAGAMADKQASGSRS